MELVAGAHPFDVKLIKFPLPNSVIVAILECVKTSTIVVKRFTQKNVAGLHDSESNGITSEENVLLSKHWEMAQLAWSLSQQEEDIAVYMHNKSLVEVLGQELTHQLYREVQPLSQDVLVNYPQFYMSDYPKSSSDVLVGAIGSWSPVHQDLPLYCSSAVLVLEGVKEFAVVTEEVGRSFPINISSATWRKPATFKGTTYPDLPALVRDTGGAVYRLVAGDMLVIPPRVFHFARNCSLTISCNFSVCTMDRFPLTLEKTLAWIRRSPRDVMHFDKDFARLLEDCTEWLIKSASRIDMADLHKLTSKGRLPDLEELLSGGGRLHEWYLLLMCIPRGWVQGFWGKTRDRLLARLQAALLRHTPCRAARGTEAADEPAAAGFAAATGHPRPPDGPTPQQPTERIVPVHTGQGQATAPVGGAQPGQAQQRRPRCVDRSQQAHAQHQQQDRQQQDKAQPRAGQEGLVARTVAAGGAEGAAGSSSNTDSDSGSAHEEDLYKPDPGPSGDTAPGMSAGGMRYRGRGRGRGRGGGRGRGRGAGRTRAPEAGHVGKEEPLAEPCSRGTGMEAGSKEEPVTKAPKQDLGVEGAIHEQPMAVPCKRGAEMEDPGKDGPAEAPCERMMGATGGGRDGPREQPRKPCPGNGGNGQGEAISRPSKVLRV